MPNTSKNRVLLSPKKILIIAAIAFIVAIIVRRCEPPDVPNLLISFDSQIRINKEDWLSDAEKISWKKNCEDNWDKKENGVSGNIDDLESYITECSRDAEAGIYYNNFQAGEKAEKTNNSTIKLAASVPISRENGVFDSIEVLKGIELAQRKINQNGGIKIGEQTIFLEIGIIDEGWNVPPNVPPVDKIDNWSSKTDKNKQRTISELVAISAINSDVVGTIGHFSSDAIEAAAPIYNNKLIAISPTSTAIRQLNNTNKIKDFLGKWLTIGKKSNNNRFLDLNNYVFRTAPNDAVAIDRLKSEYIDLNSKDINQIIIVYDETSKYSLLYREELKKQLGNKIINEDNCGFKFDDRGHLDPMEINNCANNIARYEPNALILVLSTANVSKLKSLIKIDGKNIDFFQTVEDRAGYLPKLIGSDSLYNEQYLDEGTVVSVAMEKKKQTFPTAIENLEKGYETIEVNWVTSTAYDAVIAIAEGIKNSTKCSQNDSISKCRQQIQKSLSSQKFVADGMLGKNSIRFENGDRQVLEDNDSLAVILIVKDNSFVSIEANSNQ